ncbi:hypothetical protein CDAR_40441 [Caerostris darwini]|uniref:Transmembrane protein n=1 Tax=Caerostris darwini TaxID=1538125 RepID=A0AAV4RDS1_9ARAC|nr:hypothetical protein CDAR_40441 [Caerostris darwini]
MDIHMLPIHRRWSSRAKSLLNCKYGQRRMGTVQQKEGRRKKRRNPGLPPLPHFVFSPLIFAFPVSFLHIMLAGVRKRYYANRHTASADGHCQQDRENSNGKHACLT